MLGVYVFLALAFLGVRYWALPNIDQWRGPLQRQLSTLLSVQVELGQVSAQWRGRHPHISLRDTVLRDDDGRLLLDIPALDAVVAWHSLFSGTPDFLSLRADGVAFAIRRDEHDRVSLMGREVEAGQDASSGTPSDDGILRWLSQQGNVRFTNASIVWLDERRGAPPLALQEVSLHFGADADHHVFSIRARPPAALGASLSLRGRVRAAHEAGHALSLADVSGLFYMNVDEMRPAGWAPWLDFHNVMERGRLSWEGWQEVVDGKPRRHVSTLAVQNGVWRPAEGITAAAQASRVHLEGSWLALQRIFPPQGETRKPLGAQHEDGAETVARVAVQMRGLTLDAAGEFEAPLAFDDVVVSGSLAHDEQAGFRVGVDHAQVRNADMDLGFQGEWRQLGGGEAGVIDMQGRFERAELAAIVRYLPSMVDEDARDWMRHGLLAGRLVNAPVRLRGDLAHFPFGDYPDRGDFQVGGPVQGVVIDYAPSAVVGPPGWPRLERLEGHAQLRRVDLSIHADSMQMRPAGHPIDLRDVHARIPNIEQDSILSVSGAGSGDAQAFLSLVRESPLGGLLDGVFDEANGEGRWEVPISLIIPLMDTDQTQVEGSVVFDKAGLQLADMFPRLSGIEGRVSFTERHLSAHGMKARVLGGPVAISGGVGKGHKGLVFDGSLSAQALNEYLDGRLEGILDGATSYRLALLRSDTGGYGMQLDADLQKLSINLPEPFSKPAGQRRPLNVQWIPAAGKGDAALVISLDGGMTARFLHNDGKPGDTFFHAGALNLRGKAKPAEQGLVADVQMPRIDIDAWRELADRQGGDGASTAAAIFPPLRDLRLQAESARALGTELDQLTFTARRPDGERWRVDVSSTQTAGTLFWQQRRGRIQGEVEAHFQRLALGAPPDEGDDSAGSDKASEHDSASTGLDDDLDIPGIRLTVDRFRLYGRDVGALSVVGVNEAQARRWNLQQLEVSGPHASLKGSGVWRLDGPQRGLRIQADAMFDDLGAYLEQLGFKEVMQGGHGQVTGVVEWRDVPWRFERSALQGDLSVDLAKGRMLNLGSRSARLLELLSLQSVNRLASLNWNPAGLMQQGFPFDTLQGQIKMKDGVMHSENYRVTGPVATIVIAGDVDLPKETLDLYAVLVPNLDVSGAAIAAGIAVNPIVGVGAFLTQWLLKQPMSKAMTVEYRVKGDFDAPSVEEVNGPDHTRQTRGGEGKQP